MTGAPPNGTAGEELRATSTGSSEMSLSQVVKLLSISALGCGLCLVGRLTGADDALRFERAPVVFPNPNPHVPLAAILRFKTNKPVKTMLHVQDAGKKNWDVEFDYTQNPALGLPILGMRPGMQHTIWVTVEDKNGARTASDRPIEYTTPSLPADRLEFPPLKLIKSDVSLMEPGVTFLSIRRRPMGRGAYLNEKQRAFTTQWGLILAVDNAGDVVWFYALDQRVSGIERLRNGNILFHRNDFVMTEIDMLGNTVNQWYAKMRPQGAMPDAIELELETLHHQPHELPSGDFLAFTAHGKSIDDYYSSELDPRAPRKTRMVMGDKVTIFNPTGHILWAWDSFDYLDPFRIGLGTFDSYWTVRGFPGYADWTHGNGLSYDPADDSILINLRNQDATIKVNRATKQIKWILGEHSNWPEKLQGKLLKPLGDLRWPYHGHNPRIAPNGNIIFFDNAVHQTRPFEGKSLPVDKTWSRAVEFHVDEENMTVEQVWASAHELNQDSCNAWAMGDAHVLPETNNVLVVFAMCVPLIDGLGWDENNPARHVEDVAYGARVIEYTHEQPAEEVFRLEIEDPNDLIQWNAFGGFRTPSLYPAKHQAQ